VLLGAGAVAARDVPSDTVVRMASAITVPAH
jgi:hypothetical protein